MIYGVIFLAAFVAALALTPLVRAFAIRAGVVDRPAGRKMHQVPVPRLGGAAVLLSFLAVALAVRIWIPGILGPEIDKFPAVLLGALIVALLGAYDDWKGAPPVVKFAIQTLAALILVLGGVRTNLFTNPLGGSIELGWLGIPLTLLWIVGVTNAMNLIDGLDGLAAGIGTIASLSLCAVASQTDEPLVVVISLLLAGASLGFLPYNFYPARIFLGDTGSMLLGFVLAAMALVGSLKATTATVLILPIVVLGVPVFDTLWAILRRTQSRVSPFIGDRNHIHHRLVRVGLHHRHVVLVLYFVCAFLGVSAYVIVQVPYQIGFLFAVLLGLGGVIGVSTLKYIEEHLEEREMVASAGSSAGISNRSTPPPALASALWQSTNGGKAPDGTNYRVFVCEVARFREGLAASGSFGHVASQLRETLGRRVRIYAVGAYMQEDRSLLVVLKTEPLSEAGLHLIHDGVDRFFGEVAGRWGEAGAFPTLRWIRGGPTGPDSGIPAGRVADDVI